MQNYIKKIIKNTYPTKSAVRIARINFFAFKIDSLENPMIETTRWMFFIWLTVIMKYLKLVIYKST